MALPLRLFILFIITLALKEQEAIRFSNPIFNSIMEDFFYNTLNDSEFWLLDTSMQIKVLRRMCDILVRYIEKKNNIGNSHSHMVCNFIFKNFKIPKHVKVIRHFKKL